MSTPFHTTYQRRICSPAPSSFHSLRFPLPSSLPDVRSFWRCTHLRLLVTFCWLCFLCLPTNKVNAIAWDRPPFIPVGFVGSIITLVEVHPHTLWANTARDAFGYPTPTASAAMNTTYPSAPKSPDYTSIIVIVGGLNANFQETMKMYLMPWPLSATPSQQERWVEAPIISSAPSPRDSIALISTANSYSPTPVAGRLFLHGGAFSDGRILWQMHSLWTFDVESTTWTPLGPSRMYDASNTNATYDCLGKQSELHNSLVIETVAYKGTVDECGDSSLLLRQVDEFDCPWPSARSGHVMTTVGEYTYLYGGTLTSWDAVGDVWRLKMDDHLAAAIRQQSTSVGGLYVYNQDQLKFLQNASDGTIIRGNLCPVKWELITREDGATSSLKNRPETDPFPPSRWLTSVAPSGSQLWVVSGQQGFTSLLAYDDVWMLETRNDNFQWFPIASSPTSTGRSFHASGTLYIPNLSTYLPGIATESAYAACANNPTVALATSKGLSGDSNFVNDAWILIPSGCNQTVVAPQPSPYDAPHSLLLPANSASLTWEWRQIIFPSLPLPADAFTSANMQLPDGSFIFISGQSRLGPAAGSAIYDIPNRFAIDLPSPFTGASTLSPLTVTAVELLHNAAKLNSTTLPNPQTPPPRYLHFQMYVESMRVMLVYAGRGSADFDNVYDDMWLYNVDKINWTKVGDADSATNAAALWPPLYQNQAYVASESEGVFYMFGGWPVRPGDANIDAANISPSPCGLTLYRYDIATNSWTNLTNSFKSVTTWDEAIQGNVSITAGEFHADGYVYPIGRCHSQLALLANGTEMFVFGGDTTVTTTQNPSDNSLWKLNLVTMEWKLVQQSDPAASPNPGTVGISTQKQPATRRLHSLAKISECEFIMSWGIDRARDVSYLGDMWIYSRTTGWRLVANSISDPTAIPPRAWAPIVVRTVPKPGGADTYLTVLGGYQVPVLSTNDMYSFNVHTHETTQLYPSNDVASANLIAARMVVINQGNTILLYGGSFSDSYVHELAFDECTVGTGKSSDRFAHDWLATLTFVPGFSLKVPTSYFANSNQLTTGGHVVVKPTPLAFTSLSFALGYYERSLLAGASSYTIVDTFEFLSSVNSTVAAAATSRTTAFLSSAPLSTNVTIVGLSSARSVLNCGYGCNMNIDLGSAFCGGDPGAPKAVTIKHITLMNGAQANKGGFLSISNSRVNMLNVSMNNNNATFGGAISALNSKIQLTSCNFTGNTAYDSGGAMYFVNTDAIITRCNFTRNRIIGDSLSAQSDYGQGGAVSSLSSRVQLVNSTLQYNSARVGGAISSLAMISQIPGAGQQIGVMDSGLSISGTCFTRNAALQDGGAVYASYLAAKTGIQSLSAVVQNSSFIRNVAHGNGGAVYLDSSRLVFNSTSFKGNRCNLGGGAIYWKPEAGDYLMQRSPIFYPNRTVAFPGSSGYKRCLSQATIDSLKTELMWDPQCNAAAYGPFIASPPASLRILQDSLDAAKQPQSIGTFVSPIVVQLVDRNGQLLNVDNTTFISMGPSASFAGATTLQVVKGLATFDQVILRIPPNSNVTLSFSSSIALPFLLQDQTTGGKAALTLRSNFNAPGGLQPTSNSSFAHVSSCASLCPITLNAPINAHSTTLEITFNLDLFNHDYDEVIILMDRGASSGVGTEVYTQFNGSSLWKVSKMSVPHASEHIAGNSQHQYRGRARGRDAVGAMGAGNTNLYTVFLAIPSAKVTVELRTGDDKIGYIFGQMNFSSECPVGLQLSPSENECLSIRESSKIARIIVIVAAAIAAGLVLFSVFLVLRYRLSPHFRAASASFSFTILGLLGCLCIASILFALLPDRNSNALCYARVWFATIPVIGVLSILLAKAYKVSSIALNVMASLKKASPAESRMWGIVSAAVVLQIGFCLAYTLVPVSRSDFHSQTVNGSTIRYLVRECSTESSFTAWFAAQLIFVGLIACATSFYSFQTRGVHMQYNESSHVAVSLFLIVLIAIILIPVGILVQNSPDAMVVVQGGGAAFVAIMLNFSLFFPKFSAVREVLRTGRRLAAEKAKAEEQAKITAAQLYVVGTPKGNAHRQALSINNSDATGSGSGGNVSDSLQKHKGSLAKMKKSGSSGSGGLAVVGVNQPLVSSSARVVLTSTPEFNIQEEGEDVDRMNPNDSLTPSLIHHGPHSAPVGLSESGTPAPPTSESKSTIVFHVDSKQSSQQQRQTSKESPSVHAVSSKLTSLPHLTSNHSDSMHHATAASARGSFTEHSSTHLATASTSGVTSGSSSQVAHPDVIQIHSSMTSSTSAASVDATPIASPSQSEPPDSLKIEVELATFQQQQQQQLDDVARAPSSAFVYSTNGVDTDSVFTLVDDIAQRDDEDYLENDEGLRHQLYYRSRQQHALASEQSLLSAPDSTNPSKVRPVSLASIPTDLQSSQPLSSAYAFQ